MTSYTVLVSLDGGKTWAVYAKPVPASSRQAAAESVRKQSPELRKNEDVQFLPLGAFAPLKKRKQMVEAWRWGPAKDDSTQQLEVTE